MTAKIQPSLSSAEFKPQADAGDLTQHALAYSANATGELDLAAFRVPSNFNVIGGIKKVITSAPAKKPGTQTYFRVRPGEEWQMQALILQLKEDGENYFVRTNLFEELSNECRAKVLYTYITREGNVGLWPVNMPGEDGRLDPWSESAHAAAKHAQSHWVRLVANRHLGAYDVMEASNLADKPVWPDLDFTKLVSLAFKDRVISDMSHPIVRKLRGEV